MATHPHWHSPGNEEPTDDDDYNDYNDGGLTRLASEEEPAEGESTGISFGGRQTLARSPEEAGRLVVTLSVPVPALSEPALREVMGTDLTRDS